MLHPPLYYLLSSIWIEAFGIGVWQLHLQSAISRMIGIMVVTYCPNKIYGSQTALLMLFLLYFCCIFTWDNRISSGFEFWTDIFAQRTCSGYSLLTPNHNTT